MTQRPLLTGWLTLPSEATGSALAVVVARPVADLSGDDVVSLLNKSASMGDCSTADEGLARKKAEFVIAVEQRASEGRTTLQFACALVASDAAQNGTFHILHTSGQRGESLLAGKKAWHNFRQWRDKLRKFSKSGACDIANWPALLPAYKGSRGVYVPKGDIEFYQVIWDIVLKQNAIPMRSAYKRTRALWLRKNGDDSANLIPTYDQVVYATHKLDRKILEIARNPERKYWDKNGPHTSCTPPAPNTVWVGDHHHLDLWCKDEQPDGTWRVCRPWLSLWEDWGAFAPVGWHIRMDDPDMEAVLCSLKNAVIRSGSKIVPFLKIDNGKDYTSNDVGLVFQRMGCHVSHALPYRGRSKNVERFFGVVCNHFSKWFRSYCGNSPQTRPDSAEYFRQHLELLPTLDEVKRVFEAFVNEHMATPSKSKSCNGKTPAQVLSAATQAYTPIDEGTLREMFAMRKGMRAIRCGEVVVDNVTYYSDELFRLFRNVKEVMVHRDREDCGLIYCYGKSGEKLCEARMKQMLPGHNASQETLSQAIKTEHREKRKLKDAICTLTGRSRVSTRSRSLTADIAEILGASEGEIGRQITRRSKPEPDQPSYATAADVAECESILHGQALENRAARNAGTISPDEFDAILKADAAERRHPILSTVEEPQ